MKKTKCEQSFEGNEIFDDQISPKEYLIHRTSCQSCTSRFKPVQYIKLTGTFIICFRPYLSYFVDIETRKSIKPTAAKKYGNIWKERSRGLPGKSTYRRSRRRKRNRESSPSSSGSGSSSKEISSDFLTSFDDWENILGLASDAAAQISFDYDGSD